MRSRAFIAIAAMVLSLEPAAAEQTPPMSEASASSAQLAQKLNAYVGCVNRLSGRSFEARDRYFSWVGKNGPTGKERIVYGTYTIQDPSDCKTNVAAANAMEPHDADLEAAANAYVAAVTALEPLLKEADDYYTQENYKDDNMAKGKALHPRLVAAWDAFAGADRALRADVDAINDKRAVERLAAIEASEGRKAHYYVEALMVQAKRVLRAEEADKPDLDAITQSLNEYEGTVKATEEASGKDGDVKLGSIFIGNAKSFLTTAKQLMRRVRDKVPYSSGEKMMMANAGASWMVEGSPARLTRDYNQLVDSYNRGTRI
jgi:hypothetical protein